MPFRVPVLSLIVRERLAMDGMLRTAHRKKWGRVDLEAFVKWSMPVLLNEPDVQLILRLWPVKYSDLDGKLWPTEIKPFREGEA